MTNTFLTHVDLFSGIGGFALAARWAGFQTVAFVEIDDYARAILKKNFMADGENVRLQRVGAGRVEITRTYEQSELSLRSSPRLYTDIRDFDGAAYRGATLLTGGFPCQPFSQAGKRGGTKDDRHLWPEMHRVIGECKPTWVVRKMLLESSRWNSTTCFLTWKVKATPSNRLLFQLAPSMPDTDETEFGLLPTPMSAPESEASHNQVSGRWREAMKPYLWMTPHTPNGGRVNTAEEILNKGMTKNGKRQVSLESQVKMWPTVTANTAKNCSDGSNYHLDGAIWEVEGSGSLNPTWVEWLMMYPPGWTEVK